MSVVDSMVIDGIALTEDKNGIVLLITDLQWNIIQMRIITIFMKRTNIGLRMKYIF